MQAKSGFRGTTRRDDVAIPQNAVHGPNGLTFVAAQPGQFTDLHFYATSLHSLASWLSGSATRLIEDRTGLAGSYDFVLKRNEPESGQQDPAAPTPWFLEGLGLKLVPAKAPLPTLVIDHIERPSDD